MEGVRISYSEFHKDLTLLASQVVPKFCKGTPEKLKNISYLPLLLTPEDEDFRSNNPDRLVKKILCVFETMLSLSLPLKLCVIASELEWLIGQFDKLKFFVAITYFRLFDLRLNTKIEAIISAGMGAFNTGTFSDSVNYDEAVQKIEEMLN